MRSYWSRLCPKPNVAGILVRRGKEAQKGKVAVWRRGDVGKASRGDRGRGQRCTWASLRLMATQDAKGKVWGRVSPRYSRESVALPTPRLPTSSLQDCERLIKATWFVLLVPAALGNKYPYKIYPLFV